MKKIVIKVEDVTMKFRLTNNKVDSLKEYFIRYFKRNFNHIDFEALKLVNIEIFEGDRIGIIGHNGAGKSTLLKLMTGVMKPTSGKIIVNGTVAPLLELGAGFDGEFSGAENIYLNAAILGRNKKFIDDKYDEIVEFANLGKFIDEPVKNYSSGMKARLGFSVATQIVPDILILDEILGVGDQRFKKKSTKKMQEMMKNGNTVILTSHSMSKIREYTDKCIWLDRGKVVEIGETDTVCDNYEKFMEMQGVV